MPIYEYRCADCGKRTELFQRSQARPDPPACAHCGSFRARRAPSHFATPKSEQQVLEQYGTPRPGSGPEAYRDPRQIGRWTERRLEELGVEMPQQARTLIDAAREGETLEPLQDG